MVKKLIALAGAGAMLLSVAGPALAWNGWWGGSSDVAIVGNSATAVANTGMNTQNDIAFAGGFVDNDASAGSSGARTMTTGEADAYAGALVVANTHVCASGGWGHKDFALVGNDAYAEANTGLNDQDDYAEAGGIFGNNASAGSSGARTMTTKNATSEARAWTVVNTHIGGWWGP